MTAFPRSPRVQKGAIIGLDPFNPLASVVVFQYNPDTMTRSLTVEGSGADGGAVSADALRIKKPPRENIDIKIVLDATDQLETADPIATTLGIHPQLAALEMLLYPKSLRVITNYALQSAGMIEVVPPDSWLTLFIWGIKRVVPVKLTSFSITETEFDPNLNPIRADVSLGMDILNYTDLGLVSPGGVLFMAHQIVKEVMATIGSVGNIAGVASGSIDIL